MILILLILILSGCENERTVCDYPRANFDHKIVVGGYLGVECGMEAYEGTMYDTILQSQVRIILLTDTVYRCGDMIRTRKKGTGEGLHLRDNEIIMYDEKDTAYH